MTVDKITKIQIGEKFAPLLEAKARYKVFYGGRGGSKTWTFAMAAILRALQRPTRFLCCREVQSSIRESVHKILCDRIHAMGFDNDFIINEREIRSTNGSEFIFEGLWKNIDRIRSLEGIDVCWCAEAQPISEASWQVLLPTIRKDDSELWVEFNTKFDSDPVYKRFVINTPANCISVKVGWQDNPKFPEVLRIEMENDYAIRPLEAKNIWGGEVKGYGGFIWVPPFNEKVHVRDFTWNMIKDKVNVVQAVDMHQHFYPACIWMAMIKTTYGAIYKWVFDEYPKYSTFSDYYSDVRKKEIFSGSLADLTAEFKKIELDNGVKVLRRYIDTRFAKGIGGTGFSPWTQKTDGVVEQWRRVENGALNFIGPREGIIDVQRDVVKKAMQYNPNQALNEINEPTFFVSPSCRNLIQSLKGHRLEEESEKEADTGLKDFSDCLRIGMAGIDNWHWVDDQPMSYSQYQAPQHKENAWQGL